MNTRASAGKQDLPPLFTDFMERLPAGIAVKDAELRYIYANGYLRELLGAGSWIGKGAREVHPGERGEGILATDGLALAGQAVETELSLPDRGGALRRFRLTKFRMRMAEGSYLVFSVLNDLAALDAAERALAEAIALKGDLLKEVYHRMKNNLATVASLLSLEAQTVADERLLKSFEESQSRIHSIALVNEELYGSEDLWRLDFGLYLSKIARRIAFSFGSCPNVRLELEVESLLLEASIAVPLGLVANELLTNAFKYAFAEGRQGRLALRLHRLPGGEAELSVADDGAGLPAELDPETTPSLGLQLVRSLALQVEGRAEFRRGAGSGGAGFECRVVFPLGAA